MFAKWWKNLKLGTNKLKLDFKFLLEIIFRRNNIHRKIDRWNQRRFGAKWSVTVPNSVMPVKPIVCKWTYMSPGNIVKWHTNYSYVKYSSTFSWNCDFEQFFFKFMAINAVFCRFAQQELKVSYETSMFRSMFMSYKYWWKLLSWRSGIRY